MKKITLTQGKFALVDDEDYKRLNQYRWYASNSKNTSYAERSIWVKGKKVKIKMHRAVIGRKDGYVIDHINGNGLDNRRCNLRLVTQRQNLQNIHKKRSSPYPGVSWNKSNSKWMASMRIHDKKKYLGYFSSEIEAFDAYKNAVESLTGESVLEVFDGMAANN